MKKQARTLRPSKFVGTLRLGGGRTILYATGPLDVRESTRERSCEWEQLIADASSGIDVRMLTPTDIRDYVGRDGLDFRRESVEAALARGDVCVGAFAGDQLVSYSWRATRGPVRHTPEWDVTWNPGLVYRYKALTLPNYRGLHLNEALAKTVDRHLAKQGHLVGVSFVEVVNLSSMRTLRRKGRRRVGYAGYFQRFGLFIPFRTTGCRAYGFAFRRSSGLG
jgi:hypothetical protein